MKRKTDAPTYLIKSTPEFPVLVNTAFGQIKIQNRGLTV